MCYACGSKNSIIRSVYTLKGAEPKVSAFLVDCLRCGLYAVNWHAVSLMINARPFLRKKISDQIRIVQPRFLIKEEHLGEDTVEDWEKVSTV